MLILVLDATESLVLTLPDGREVEVKVCHVGRYSRKVTLGTTAASDIHISRKENRERAESCAS